MIGYTGAEQLWHETADCSVLTGSVREIPESKALKWGINHCPECVSDVN